MKNEKRLHKAFKAFDKSLAKTALEIPGKLGIKLNGKKLVEVPNRNAFVYVQLNDNQSEVIQAFNDKVAPSYGLPVIVTREGNRYKILGRDTQRYSDWESYSPFLPRHGHTHELDIEGNGAGDVVFTYSRQFTPLMTYPSGTDGGPNLILSPYTLQNPDNSWRYIPYTGTPNISPIYNPQTGTQAVMVTVYFDTYTGNPGLLVGSGSYFSSTLTGSADIMRYVPQVTDPMHIPLTAVRLVTGTTFLSWDNIYDLRQFLHFEPTGTAGGGGLSSVAVQDEGVPKGNVTTFNFVGTVIDASVSGSVARIFATGTSAGVPASGGSGTITVFDEGILKGQVAELEFVGLNVDASVSGSRARIFVTGSTGGGGIPSGTIQIYNTGTFVGSADKFDYQYPLYVGFTGTRAYPSLRGSPVAFEDVSYQVSGTVTHFNISGTADAGTERLYYNGLRQKNATHFTLDANGRGFTTLFTGTSGDTMVLEYGNLVNQAGSGAGGTSTGTTTTIGGRYTPFVTGTFNVASAAPVGTLMYTRIGNIVQVQGAISIDPVAASLAWVLVSLPVASNLTQSWHLAGMAAYPDAANPPGIIDGDTTENMAFISIVPTSNVSRNWSVNFMYEVL